MTGGGFGGCTVSLVKREYFPDFETKIKIEYEKKFGVTPAVYIFQASEGVGNISI